MALGLYEDDDPIYQTSQQARANLPVYGGVNQADLPAPPRAGIEPPDFDEPTPPPQTPQPQTSARAAELAAQGFRSVTAAPSAPPGPAPQTAREMELEAQGYRRVSLAPPPSTRSNFGRGLETSWEQLKQTGGGAVALIGDTFGLDSMKNWGLEKYQAQDEKVQALSSENDDVFKAMSKDGSFTDWLGYAAGYTLGQAGQMVATGGVGGLIGKALLQKGVQKFAAGMVERKAGELMAEELIAKGASEAAAKEGAAKLIAANTVPDAVKNKAVSYASQMIGATIAATALNAQQELGSVYGDAVQQAQESGVPVNLAKVWAGGAGAAALDTFTDMGALGRALHGAGHGSNVVARVAKAGTAQAMKEAVTEGIQTIAERWGAQKSIADMDALHDVINSAAMGAVGGGGAGAVAGVMGRSKAQQQAREQGTGTQPTDLSGLPEEDIGDVTLGRGPQPTPALPAPGETTPGRAGLVPTTPTEQPTSDAEAENDARWQAREEADRNRVLYGHLAPDDADRAQSADSVAGRIAEAAKAGDLPSVKAGVAELVGNAQSALNSIGARPDIYSTLGQAQAAMDALAEKHGRKPAKARGLQPTVETPPAAAALAAAPETPAAVAAPVTALPEPTAVTNPEPVGDVQAQLAAMADPQNPKDAVFIAKGTATPSLPPGSVRVHKPEGLYVTTNPAKARAIAGPAALDDAQRAAFLGIPEGKQAVAAKSVAKGTPPVAVSAKDKKGNVVAQAVTDVGGQNVPAVAAQTPKGGKVEVTSIPAILEERAAKVADEAPALLAPTEPPAATKAKATSKRLAKEKADAVQVKGAAGVLQPAPQGTGKGGGKRGRVEPVVEGEKPAAEGAGKKPPRQAKVNEPQKREANISIEGTDANDAPSTLKVWTEGDKIVRAEQHTDDGAVMQISTKSKDTLANVLRRVEDDFTPKGKEKVDVEEQQGQGEGEGTPQGTQPDEEAAGQRTPDEALKALRRTIKQAGRKAAPRTVAENATRAEREAVANAHLAPDFGIDHAVTLVDTPKKEEAFVSLMETLLGQKVQFFSPATKDVSNAIDGFKVPGDPDTVYVNVNNEKPYQFIIGHEIGHNIRELRPKLWSRFMEEVVGLSDRKEFEKYLYNLKAALEREATARGESRPSRATVGATTKDEVSADALGTALMDPEFWKLLHASVSAEKKPLVLRMMEEVAAMLKQMMRALHSSVTGNPQAAMFKDVRALHRSVRDLIVDFRGDEAEEMTRGELTKEAASVYEQKMEPDEAEGQYPWADLSPQGKEYWVEMYDLYRHGDIDIGELLREFQYINAQDRRNRMGEAASGAVARSTARVEAETLWDEKMASKTDPDFDDLSGDHKNYFIRAVYDSAQGKKGASPTAAYDQIMAWRKQEEAGQSEEQKRQAKIDREAAKAAKVKAATEEKAAKAKAVEKERKAAIAAMIKEEMPAITERMGNLSPRDQEVVAKHFGATAFNEKIAKRLSLRVADVLTDPKSLMRALPDDIRPVIRRIVGGVKYSRALLGDVGASDVKTVEGAKAIRAMDAEKRDNTELGDMPGGSTAYNLYEAQNLLPRASDKVKRITDDNSFSLYQDYHAIANVDGVLYGISKNEDPDAESDDLDRHGDPKEFVYSYQRLDRPSDPSVDTHINDPKELVEEIRATKPVQYSRKQGEREQTLERVEPKITGTGKIVGAPPGKNTPAHRARLVQKLTKLMAEPYAMYAKSKEWYEDSGKDIARLTKGDPAMQEALIRLTAYYSQGVQVGANTTFTVRAMHQMLAGKDIHSGIYPNVQSPRAQRILAAKEMDTSLPGVDNKLMNFYRNLKDATTGEDHYDNASTLDRWMMRVFGYKHSQDEEVGGSQSMSTPQYEYGKDVMHRVAEAWEKQTGEKLKQRQVQAVLWTYIKNKDVYDKLVQNRNTSQQAARIYGSMARDAEELGITKKDALFYADFAEAMEKKHALYAKKVAEFEPVSLNYSDYFDTAQARVLYEVRPSTAVDVWPFVRGLGKDDLREFSNMVRATLIDPKTGRDELMNKVGLPLHSMSNGSTGSWDGTVSPNFVSYAIQDKNLGKTGEEGQGEFDPKPVNVYADALGYLLRQDSVFWFRPAESGKNVGVSVTTPEMPAGFEDRLYAQIKLQLPLAEFTRDGDEIFFVNTRGIKDAHFLATIHDVVDTMAAREGLTLDTTDFKTDANFHDNHWIEDPNGEGYASRLRQAGRSDLLPWLDGKRREIDALADGYSAQRGERPSYSRKAAASVGTDQAEAAGLQQRPGVQRGVQPLDVARGQNRGAQPIKGLPQQVVVDGKTVTFGPHEPAQRAAEAYAEKAGLTYERPAYQKLDPARAARIAQAFDNMAHAPDDPAVQRSYAALVRETVAQWKAIKATGLKVEFMEPGVDPYGNPRNAILDVVNNNHLWVYPTDQGFGSLDTDTANHPLLATVPGERISGQKVTVNDLFRIVHDYFGHVKEGIGFRAEGEDNAWRQHATMFSDAALPALTTETRGQNSWVNYGPFAESNQTASPADTRYADQKVGLLPDWTYGEASTEAPEQRAARVSYSRKDLLNPVEVYAMKGDKIVGMAAFNVPNKTWFIYKAAPGGDIRQNYTESHAATTEDALNALREKGVRLVRRKESPLMQGQHDVWNRGPDALFNIDTTPTAANNHFTKAVDATLDKLGMKGAGPTVRRNLTRMMQDAYIDLKSVQDKITRQGGVISADSNVYQKVTMFPGSTGAKLDAFTRQYVEPLEAKIKEAIQKGATLKDIEQFLVAQHAKERNEQIEQRTAGKKLDGSGVSTREAASRLRAYAASPYAAELQQIGKIADDISAFKIGVMEEGGLINADTATALRQYEHYRPLRGLDDDDTGEITGGMGVGTGFSGKASLLKYALGRDTEAKHVISHMLLDAEAKIVRSGKNVVALSLAKLAEDHPDPKFWTVNPMKAVQTFNPETGTIRYHHDSGMMDPNIVTAFQNGQPIKIELKDDSFAQMITNARASETTWILDKMRTWNKYLAMMMTSLNPEWGLVNAARDAQTAFFNIASDSKLPAGTSKTVMKELLALSGHKDIYKAITDPAHPSGLGKWYKELEAMGGITKFFSLETLKDRTEKLAEIEKRVSNPNLKSRFYDQSLAAKAVQLLEDANATIEAAPRVITYKALVEAGWSKIDAADYAKNLTVNFDRKGSQRVLSAAYLFFNPAVQGTARLYEALKTPQGKAVATGLFAMGFIAGLTGNAGGDDDKNGIPDYQQLSDWDRATNITPFAHGPKIPLPYGWNAFYAMGNFLSDAFFGRSPMGAAWASMKAARDAFNPIGGSESKSALGWGLKQVMPTAIDPALELVMNENRYGGNIARQQSSQFGPKQPASQMGGMGATKTSKLLASALNTISGGSAASSGLVDVNPDQIDYLAGTMFPGVATSAARSVSTVGKLATGEPTDVKDWPVARRVYVEPSKGKVYEALQDAKAQIGEFQNIQKNGSAEERAALAKEHPGWAGIAAGFTVYGKQVGDLYKRKAGIIDGKIKVADETAEKTKIDAKVLELENRQLLTYRNTSARW